MDLFCILYGVSPLFNLTKDDFEAKKERYVASHRRIHSVRKQIGMAAMVDHQWLTGDRKVQKTVWSSGHHVVVNFSGQAHTLGGGERVDPMGFRIYKQQQGHPAFLWATTTGCMIDRMDE